LQDIVFAVITNFRACSCTEVYSIQSGT